MINESLCRMVAQGPRAFARPRAAAGSAAGESNRASKSINCQSHSLYNVCIVILNVNIRVFGAI